jgi:hypothetical protein
VFKLYNYGGMNPNNNETGLNLPPPVTEQAPSGEVPAPADAEKLPAAPEQAPAPSQSAPASMPALDVPAIDLPAQDAASSAVNSTTTQASPITADDGDLIEKEWVEKAKQIVERTRDDPYRQSEELTVVKAEYMQKRYNKTVKVSK